MPWNLDCNPWVSWSYFYKTTKLHETQASQSKFHGIK